MAFDKKKQRAEAVRSLEKLVELGLDPEVLENFREGVVCLSQRIGNRPGEAFLSSVGSSAFGSLLDEFERRHGRLVYHAFLERMSFGPVLYLLSVPSHEEGYEGAMCDLEQRWALAYGANLDNPDCSEFGYVPLAVSGGVLYDLDR